jgi:ubiquinone/menaquinone biosynthesis C-methylase UbiE
MRVDLESSGDDLLWRHLKTVPAFRALLRSVEARLFQQLDVPNPCLDLGCGDGHFAKIAFRHPLSVGIDPWRGPLEKARRAGSHRLLFQGMGHLMPFSDNTFSSVISNSVLEHIPNIQPVLHEVNRVLKDDGLLIFTTPSEHFTKLLAGGKWFDNHGFGGLAESYRKLFNKISRHYHTDSPDKWLERLEDAGFSVEKWQYYFSEVALHAMEIGHIQGIPSVLIHALTGHWIVAPWEKSLRPTEQWVRPLYEEEYPELGTMMLFIARKISDK